VTRFIGEYRTPFQADDDHAYVVRIYADRQPRGSWEARLVFLPLSGGPPLTTDRETTQRNPDDVMFWANGIGRVYLEGALRRARRDDAIGRHDPVPARDESPAAPAACLPARWPSPGRARPVAGSSAPALPAAPSASPSRAGGRARRAWPPRGIRLLCAEGCAFQREPREARPGLRPCPYRPGTLCRLIHLPG